MRKETIILLLVLFTTMFAYSASAATFSINWTNPNVSGKYYWENFTLNISTNITTNCSYKIDLSNGTSVIPLTNMSYPGAKTHTANISISDLIYHGENYTVSVYCENSLNSSDNLTEQKWFLRDYTCGDDVTHDWTLGHDLNCTSYNGNSLNITSDNVDFNCNGHHISTSTSNITFYMYQQQNVTIENCNIDSTKTGVKAWYSNNTKVLNSHIDATSYTVLFSNGYNNINVSGNTLAGGETFFNEVNGLTLFGNDIENATSDGVSLNYVNGTIKNNVIKNCSNYAVMIDSGSGAITIYNNSITDSPNDGLYIKNAESLMLNITENNVSDNRVGLDIESTFGGGIYKNIFTGNMYPVQSNVSVNIDYNEMGNYWGRNTCPAFIPGVDSNSTTVMDRFPYKDPAMALSDQCLTCGATLDSSYTLQNDMNCAGWNSSNTITIGASNVTLNCNNHNITSNDSVTAVYARSYDNVSILNCKISHGNTGIFLSSASGGLIEGNIISDIASTGYGIYDRDSYNDTIKSNFIYNGGKGIFVYSVKGNEIIGNNITNITNSDGITIYNAVNNVLVENNTMENVAGWGINFNTNNNVAYSPGVNIINNTIESSGNGIYAQNGYWENLTISNNTIINVNQTGQGDGIIVNGANSPCLGYIKVEGNFIKQARYRGLVLMDMNSNIDITVSGNTISYANDGNVGGHGLEVADLQNPFVNITNNNITQVNNAPAVYMSQNDQQNIIFYKNLIYDTYTPKVSVDTNYSLDYNGMGNYWGYSGNVCPGFVPGVDSNNLSVIDRYPYNNAAFTDYACDCGDEITQSVTLYRDITCNSGTFALRSKANNTLINCAGHKISSNKSVIGFYIGSFGSNDNITLQDCVFDNTTKGVASYNSFNINLDNVKVNNSEFGVFFKNTTNVSLLGNELNNNTINVVFNTVYNSNLNHLNMLASEDSGIYHTGIEVFNSTGFNLRNSNILTKGSSVSPGAGNTNAIYFQNVTSFRIENVNISGFNQLDNLGFGNNMMLYSVANGYIGNVQSRTSYGYPLFIEGVSNVTINNSVMKNKFANAGSEGFTIKQGSDVKATNIDTYFTSIVNVTDFVGDNLNANLSILFQQLYLYNTSGQLTHSTFPEVQVVGANNFSMISNDFENPCSQIAEGCGYAGTVILTNCSNMNLFNNTLIHNGDIEGVTFVGNYTNESNITIDHNYWGHDTCPLFLYYRDSNSLLFWDHEPLDSSMETKQCNLTFNGLTILQPPIWMGGTSIQNGPIANHSDNDWYYYYNNGEINLEINVVPSNFRIMGVTLTSLLNDSPLNCSFMPANNNRTEWISTGCNLTGLNLTRFCQNPNYPLIITYTDVENKSGSKDFMGVINVNPINNLSIAYDPELGGATTNWSTIEDFSNVTNLTFEEPGVGRITFTDSIDLLDDETLQALEDLSDNINISDGFVDVNSAMDALRAFNKSAIVYLNLSLLNTPYNLSAVNASFLETRIRMNGEPWCINRTCNVSYNASTTIINFTVPHWTSYEVDITPPTVTSVSPSSNIASSSELGVVLKAVTDENATCKYDTTDKSYDSMNNTMSGSALSHTATVTLKPGYHYKYYVRCRDTVNNTMTSSKVIEFSVYVPASGGGSLAAYLPQNPYSLWLGRNSAYYFYVGSYTHSLRIANISENKATFLIRSTPIYETLSVGEEKNIDIDGDGTPDLYLELVNVSTGNVEIKIGKPQNITSTQQSSSSSSSSQSSESSSSSSVGNNENQQSSSSSSSASSSSSSSSSAASTSSASSTTTRKSSCNVKACVIGLIIIVAVVLVVYGVYLVVKKKKYY